MTLVPCDTLLALITTLTWFGSSSLFLIATHVTLIKHIVRHLSSLSCRPLSAIALHVTLDVKSSRFSLVYQGWSRIPMVVLRVVSHLAVYSILIWDVLIVVNCDNCVIDQSIEIRCFQRIIYLKNSRISIGNRGAFVPAEYLATNQCSCSLWLFTE